MVAFIPAVLLAIAQQPSVTIGTAVARPGQAVSGFIDVPAGVDSGTRIPITIVRGAQPGPTLALIAGTHGSEVAPIVALQRVRATLDPAGLRGTVLIVHVANVPSFLGRTVYYSPVDGKNLNRVYPGRADGTVSERIAHAITREIIERADYLVDIHSGDGNESLRPYTYCCATCGCCRATWSWCASRCFSNGPRCCAARAQASGTRRSSAGRACRRGR
jgi:predicted deacylase